MPAPDPVQVAARALAEGRVLLTEPESYAVAEALGLLVPRHVIVGGASEVDERCLAGLPGDRVVVKAVTTAVTHKAAAGLVGIVPRECAAVAGAIEEMAGRPVIDRIDGYLIAEHVSSEGPEILVGLRRTAAFGTVVTVAAGGVLAESLAGSLGSIVVDRGTTSRGVERALRRGPGFVPADPVWLGELVSDICARVDSLPDSIVEFESNPVVAVPEGAVALDALGRVGVLPAPGPARPGSLLDRLLAPASIAIVGVSSGENPGRVILRNVLGAGFPADRITVVKPGADVIDGVRCVPTVADLPRQVDLLVVSIGAADAVEVVEDVARDDRAASLVLIPGGLGEREGSEPLADRLRAAVSAARSRGGGPVVVGGNCMGIRSVPGRFDTTFIPPERLAAAPDAPVAPLAVISQSGAFAIARLDRFPDLRPKYLVTVGNQIDVTVADVLGRVSVDPGVDVAACYVEGFPPGDGTRFLDAARRMTGRGAAVILMLGGRTPEGHVSAASHTSAIATDAVVAAALAADAGVLVAADLDEFEDLVRVAVALSDGRFDGRRLGAVSNAGFEAVAIADTLGVFRLAAFSGATQRTVGRVLSETGIGEVVGVRNPLDLTPITGDAGYGVGVAAVLDDPGVDAAIVGCVPLTPSLAALGDPGEGSIGTVLAELAGHETPWVAVVDGGAAYESLRATLTGAGVPVFTTADRAMRAFSRYVRWRTGD